MRRFVSFLIRNWPLKLAAILLATLLYAGLIVSASAETFQGRIPIQVLNQPTNAFLIGNLDDVTAIRYFAVGTNRPLVTSASFTATIDLGGVNVTSGSPPISVPVTVRATDPSLIQIIDFTPGRIQVRLDPIVQKDVPVTVNRGTVPDGLDIRDPVVSQDTVTISGPESYVRQVVAAEARVRIQPSGISINESVDLVAIDAKGDAVDAVQITPGAVRVTIQIGSQLATKALPVNPVVTGTPAAHVIATNISVTPILVTVEAESAILGGLAKIDTIPVSISGATATVTQDVQLDLPPGVSALGLTTVRVVVMLEPEQGTRSFQVGLSVLNGDPGLGYALGADSVIATIGGPLAILDNLDPTAIIGTLDVTGLGPGRHQVPVTIRLASGLSVVAIAPQEVLVTVTRPATPAPVPPSPSPSATP